MSDSLRSHMPLLYGARLPELFDRPIIEETRATCARCAMCDHTGAAASDGDTGFFEPDVKCCSYHPTLPNYLVGAALRDTSPAQATGRERLRAKIAARVGITPGWVAAPRKYLVLYDAARESSFGRSESLLCPYYVRDGGSCSIWPYRESICATFFCKHVAGATGHAFWRALRRYLAHVEAALSRYAIASLGEGAVEPDLPRMRLTREDLEDRPPTAADYASHWGAWLGREEAFYIECAAVVEGVTQAEYARVVDDAGGREMLAETTSLYDALTTPKLAPRLVRNPVLRAVPAEGGAFVTTYSRYDPLFVTQDLFDALGEFSADETTAEVLERLRRDHDVELPESLLLEMQVHGVMTPPARAPDAT
jgi:hypothetical protein